MRAPKLIALLGSSGSGKSELAHSLALRYDCEIFSLDSLAIYRGLDMVAAKPSAAQQREVRYHALSLLEPSEPSNAMVFHRLLLEVVENLRKPLLIVGGSSFFLKSILEGLSPMPEITPAVREWVEDFESLVACYEFLQSVDSKYAASLHPSDRYRIHRALSIYKATQMPPSEYFRAYQKVPFPHRVELYCLTREREELRERIAARTRAMIESHIVGEVEAVLARHGAEAPALKAIGAKECVSYLSGGIDSLQELEEQIFYHTCQLAKRQRTFNRTQFHAMPQLDYPTLYARIADMLGNQR